MVTDQQVRRLMAECLSESMAAIKRGTQSAFLRLGRIPQWHQTDHSTAATHEIGAGERGFNRDHLAFMAHIDVNPRTIGVCQWGWESAGIRCIARTTPRFVHRRRGVSALQWPAVVAACEREGARRG